MRFYYITHTALETYNYFNLHTSFLHFKNILIGKSYFNIPIYSKIKKKWLLNNQEIDINDYNPVSTISESGE